MTNLKYHNDERVDIVIIKYRDGTEERLTNKKCLEILKKKSLKIDSVQLLKSSKNIEEVYPKEVCNKWIALLTYTFPLNMKASYTITDEYHIININYADFDGIGQLYINLILLRYLWYNENNHLIYRIFDIKEKTNYNVEESIILAHYYDNFLTRDQTFNLFTTVVNFNRNIFYPINEYTINVAYDAFMNRQVSDSYYTIMYNYLKVILTGNYVTDKELINDMWTNTTTYVSNYDKDKNTGKINFLNHIFGLKLSLTDSNDFKEGDLLMNVGATYNPQIIKFTEWYMLGSSSKYIRGRTLSDSETTQESSYYRKIITNEN